MSLDITALIYNKDEEERGDERGEESKIAQVNHCYFFNAFKMLISVNIHDRYAELVQRFAKFADF